MVWPSSSPVARAYVDQLARSEGIPPERADALRAALGRADQLQTGRESDAAATLDELDALATQLERDGAAASVVDAVRLQSLAATLKGFAAKLR